jgi:hypothetical protein
LSDPDEVVHAVGAALNWNESRYVDFFDLDQQIGGRLRIGNRPNEGRGEMSACLNLPDGTTAFMFSRPPLSANALELGGQVWEVREPWRAARVRYSGEMLCLADPFALYRSRPITHIGSLGHPFVCDVWVPAPRPNLTVQRSTPASWPATCDSAILWPATRP